MKLIFHKKRNIVRYKVSFDRIFFFSWFFHAYIILQKQYFKMMIAGSEEMLHNNNLSSLSSLRWIVLVSQYILLYNYYAYMW